MIQGVQQLAQLIGVKNACDYLGVPRTAFYRYQEEKTKLDEGKEATRARQRSPRSLSPEEREHILDVLHSDRFVNMSPGQIVATLLDEGVYLCSERTMYRLLEERGEVKDRRNQLTHPHYTKPELVATGPNQVWSWDITKLKGPATWTYFYLYVILDIFSRYVVGWMVAKAESAILANHLIAETCQKQNIEKGQLTIHSDRGPSMRSKLLAQMLADLGVTKSHSRPHVSNDNPFSESQFKTLKYRPEFPARFESYEHAKEHCQLFFDWYNKSHRHSGIAMLTPEQLHYGEAKAIIHNRNRVLEQAYRRNPERFFNGPPEVSKVPDAVWINPPLKETTAESSP